MKVGDLVRWRRDNDGAQLKWEWDKMGLILHAYPGYRRTMVLWSTGVVSSYPASNLEVISECA